MDAALAALLGALIGAVASSATSFIIGRQARQDSREARLFDHRREAYASFLSQARSSLNAAAEWYWEDPGPRGPDIPEDALVPLYDARAEVSLYGTAESELLTGEVFDAVSTFAFKSDTNENYKAAEASIARFVARARVDLGVPK